MKHNKKIAIGMCILLLGMTAVLSGCISSVTTIDWSNSERFDNGVILKGAAPQKHEGFALVKVMFVFDEKSHQNWEDYKIRIEENEMINKKEISGTVYFEAEIPELEITKVYYFRAVALYAHMEQSPNDWVMGEEISFSLAQGNAEKSIIPQGIIKEQLLEE
jgi:hypothetical protein